VSNTAPTEAELSQSPVAGDSQGQIRNRSSSDIKNYEVSKRIATTMAPSTKILKINAAVLLRSPKVIDPETGLEVSQPLSDEKIEEIRQLITSAVGIDTERGDKLTVSSAPFISTLEGVEVTWHEIPLIKNLIKQLITISILAIVALGVIRPLLSRMLVPVGSGVAGEIVSGMDDDIDLDTIEVKEGESLEDIKAKLKPKKQAISAEMLDTANTYDDKVAVIRMIVQDESGRVSNVFKNMIQRDMN